MVIIGWLLGQAMQWIIGFIGVVMFAAAALGLGWTVNFVYEHYHRIIRRSSIRRRRRYNG